MLFLLLVIHFKGAPLNSEASLAFGKENGIMNGLSSFLLYVFVAARVRSLRSKARQQHLHHHFRALLGFIP